MTNGGGDGEVKGWSKPRGDAGVVQLSAPATELAGVLEFAIAFGLALGFTRMKLAASSGRVTVLGVVGDP